MTGTGIVAARTASLGVPGPPALHEVHMAPPHGPIDTLQRTKTCCTEGQPWAVLLLGPSWSVNQAFLLQAIGVVSLLIRRLHRCECCIIKVVHRVLCKSTRTVVLAKLTYHDSPLRETINLELDSHGAVM